MRFKTALIEMGACNEAVEWVGHKSLEKAWNTCERGDWMLWLLGHISGAPASDSRRKLVSIAAECAGLVLPIYEASYPNDSCIRDCIETCKRYAVGQATIDDVLKARSTAADAAAAAAYAADYDAAVYAAYAAASYASAYVAYAAVYAASAASYAASDAAYAASYAASYASDADSVAADAASDAVDARAKIRKQCADIVRKHYPTPPKINI